MDQERGMSDKEVVTCEQSEKLVSESKEVALKQVAKQAYGMRVRKALWRIINYSLARPGDFEKWATDVTIVEYWRKKLSNEVNERSNGK